MMHYEKPQKRKIVSYAQIIEKRQQQKRKKFKGSIKLYQSIREAVNEIAIVNLLALSVISMKMKIRKIILIILNNCIVILLEAIDKSDINILDPEKFQCIQLWDQRKLRLLKYNIEKR
ncbi:unnamed protein product [Paramecium sonneborni]|uniref:Uncharacterized protein n=1 Tax=Paramecium sonneborni TaxID=65129 RepID=A0A8S1MBJ2_9CILI|nr:unnamed protein product [Paramecium sonneborni]